MTTTSPPLSEGDITISLFEGNVFKAANCIYEKVITPRISNVLKQSDHIFLDYQRIYFETSIQN